MLHGTRAIRKLLYYTHLYTFVLSMQYVVYIHVFSFVTSLWCVIAYIHVQFVIFKTCIVYVIIIIDTLLSTNNIHIYIIVHSCICIFVWVFCMFLIIICSSIIVFSLLCHLSVDLSVADNQGVCIKVTAWSINKYLSLML